jgi:DNA-binding transcriptional LysR family regulator
LDEGRRLLASGQDHVSGVLQLSAPSDFGRNQLLPWLDEFQREHPQLSVRLLLGDRIADLFRQPVDIALRYGEPEDSSLIALPIAPQNVRVLVPPPATSRATASRATWSNWPSTIACCTCSAAASMTIGVFMTASATSA